MSEAAQILALFSALSLLASVAIWAVLLRGPLLQRLDGRRVSNAGPAALAIQLLMLAVGVSAVAAMLAVAGWIFL
jgi:hypothetical protein